MDYTVYCDESRHDGSDHNPFMAIGGLWVPSARKMELTKALRKLFRDSSLKAEVKWNKVSNLYLESYIKIIDFFFSQDELRFRAIVVEHEKVDYENFHGGDKELGFYKFYYEMLIKWIEKDNQYLILLDYKNTKGANRYTTLRTILERSTKGNAWIKDLTVINSKESPLAQLADLLTGVVAAEWCGIEKDTPKAALANYIAEKCEKVSLKFESNSPAICKFNIFKIDI